MIIELPDRDHVVWLARARGYKTMDEYALVKGYDEQRYGQAIACIINPHAKIETGFVQCFADIHEASDYLTFLRKKYGSKG